MKSKVLFVGRFQPPHKGHLGVIKKLAKKYNLTVVIGSAEKHHESKNPFTAAEREKMIRAALAEEKIKGVKIIRVPDYDSDKKWAAEVLGRAGRADAVVSGNRWVWKCLKPHGVEPFRLPFPKRFSSTKIRVAMRAGKPWKHLVPPAVFKIVKKIEAEKRTRSKI